MRNHIKIITFVFLVCLNTMDVFSQASTKKSSDLNAKDLYFQRSDTNKNVSYPGMKYWLELEGVGPVMDDRIFYSGDRIRIKMRSNHEGYLYLLAYDSSNKPLVIYPEPDSLGDNRILADVDYSTPGHIVFKPPAANERLTIIFTLENRLPLNADGLQLIAQDSMRQGSKDLSFERETKDKSKFGGYAVNRNNGPVIIDLILKHKAR